MEYITQIKKRLQNKRKTKRKDIKTISRLSKTKRKTITIKKTRNSITKTSQKSSDSNR